MAAYRNNQEDASRIVSARAREPRSGDLIAVLGRTHRVLTVVSERVLMTDVISHHVYLVGDDQGVIGLPTATQLGRLLSNGQARPLGGHVEQDVSRDNERMKAELELLEAAQVRNGTKSILIWLAANWSDDLRVRFGEHDDPATIKRWRSAKRKLQRAAQAPFGSQAVCTASDRRS